jgi:hypothetical protein
MRRFFHDISADVADETLARDFNHVAILWRCDPSEGGREAAWYYFQAAVENPTMEAPAVEPVQARHLRVA